VGGKLAVEFGEQRNPCWRGKVDKEAMIDGLEGLEIKSPTARMTIGKNHHAAMTLFLAKTKGRDLVTVRALGEITPEPGCR